MAVLVPVVAAPVIVYASVHEDEAGLPRLLGLMTVFVASMELLVLAGDLLTLLIAWELVGALSWALIGADWRDVDNPKRAAHAFNATRFGGIGLFLAAGAAFAGTGSLAYADLGGLSGSRLSVVAAGVLTCGAVASVQLCIDQWDRPEPGGSNAEGRHDRHSLSRWLHYSSVVLSQAVGTTPSHII